MDNETPYATSLEALLDGLHIGSIVGYIARRLDAGRSPTTQSFTMQAAEGETLACFAFTAERGAIIKAAIASAHPIGENPIELGLRQQLITATDRVKELESYIDELSASYRTDTETITTWD